MPRRCCYLGARSEDGAPGIQEFFFPQHTHTHSRKSSGELQTLGRKNPGPLFTSSTALPGTWILGATPDRSRASVVGSGSAAAIPRSRSDSRSRPLSVCLGPSLGLPLSGLTYLGGPKRGVCGLEPGHGMRREAFWGLSALSWCLRLDLGVSERLGCDGEGSCVLLPACEALVDWKGRRGREGGGGGGPGAVGRRENFECVTDNELVLGLNKGARTYVILL